jgi:hypothetical protein
VTAVPALLRGAYGLALCAAPGTVIGLAGGPPASRRARTVARVLGVRQLAQAAASGRALAPDIGTEDRAALLTLSALVDALHAASMLGLAVLDPPRRRAGLADGLIALAFAAEAVARLP